MLSNLVTQTSATPATRSADEIKPWPALFSLVLGFFMILVDLTIVTVATPTIIEKLHASVNETLWVSSAYMLAYAVPVLIMGRLGDRYGSKKLYLIGLVVFTLASLWCGLSGGIAMLIIARVVQGFGASMITPQTMAIITRIFPAAERGKAMAVWGATAGVAMVVGPILGGVLTTGLGWEWIFFVNIPVGIVGFVLAVRNVPSLSTNHHKFDWLGVVLSGVGLFLLAFGIQQGHQEDWAGWIIAMIVGGVVMLVAFVYWQSKNKQEPLVPLSVFRDRNFSVSTVAITVMGFVGVSMGYPLMLWAQAVLGYSATRAALLLFPMAVMSIILAKFVGGLTDRVHPRYIVTTGFVLSIIGMFSLATQIKADTSIPMVALFQVILGCGNAFIWAPTAATANRNLPLTLAGAGAGVYNATRQVGSVVGSAAIAVMMSSRLAHFIPGAAANGDAGARRVPVELRAPFAHAMQQAFLLPAAVYVIGLVAVLFYERPKHSGYGGAAAPAVAPEAASVDA
ncbi:MAG: drug resistance transporter, EmrB/QacA subfamily [Marmoricola sp.]|nr:drug resistance transporter, EmrB/QacA subfamily [Marmoricola sp.]